MQTTQAAQVQSQDGRVFSAWRESYTLTLFNGEYKITTSIDH
jgi:hypothetical protein